MSLGVDLVPKKVCSLDCVYCEVGKTTKLTIEKKEYIPYSVVTAELAEYFVNNPDPDFITFSGSGEPTLNSGIGEVLEFIKLHKPNIPIAVLTNGTMLSNKLVRDAIKKADLVLPSLDAATEDVFRKINCPQDNLSIETYIEGLISFSKEFKGKIWLEIFILPGYNNHPEELTELKKAILRIKPDSVQLNTLDRPGAIHGLIPATNEELRRIKAFWMLPNVEIIASAPQRKNIQAYRKDMETAITETIIRRPCTMDDLTELLRIPPNEIIKYLNVLTAENKIETVSQERGIFYQVKHK